MTPTGFDDLPVERMRQDELEQLLELVDRNRPVHPHRVARLLRHVQAIVRDLRRAERELEDVAGAEREAGGLA